MSHDSDRVERELLSLATEDWYALAEALSVVNRVAADRTLNERDMTKSGIRSLLDRGWLRLARLNFATNDVSYIRKEDEAEVLGDEASWVGPDAQNPWAVVFGSTEAGEREYFGDRWR